MEASVRIGTSRGLHATPACMLVQLAITFFSAITISINERKVNAKSIVGVLALGGQSGDILTITADGEDEEEAIAALVDLIDIRNFDGE